jgi:hypothetical protein
MGDERQVPSAAASAALGDIEAEILAKAAR